MKRCALIALCALAASCASMQVTAQKDSVRVEYRERVVTDTALFTVPVEVEKVVTFDTVSVLENGWARSEAKVEGGLLSHSLNTKEKVVKVPCYVTVRDTVMVEKEQKVVEVERTLTWWQEMWITCGKIAAGMLLLLMILLVIQLIIKIKKR